MSSPLRKPRADSLLDGLEEDQIATLCDWLLTPGQSYKVTRELCGKEFGVWPSNSQLSRFYTAQVGPELLARRRRAVTVSTEIAAEVERVPGRFDAATIDALRQKAFELAANPMTDPRDVKAIFSLVLKARDQDQKDRVIDLDARKVAMQEAAKSAVTEAGKKLDVTPDVLAQIVSALDARLTAL